MNDRTTVAVTGGSGFTGAALIKRLLDIGAEGLLMPQIDSPDEIRQAIQFAKYPPRGVRGVAVERSTRWGLELAEGTRRADAES